MTTDSRLPSSVSAGLDALVEAFTRLLGDDLVSLTLFGSAAEGRLRASSDVNVLVVVREGDAAVLAALRQDVRKARLAIGLEPMIIREDELAEAASAFAEKFADARGRRRVLAGKDVLASLEIPREALKARLAQSLLNMLLRLRRALVQLPGTDDRAAAVLSEMAGPLRGCAHALLELEGGSTVSPREALAAVAGADAALAQSVARLSEAREARAMPADAADEALRRLIVLTQSMRTRLAALR